MPFMMGKRFNIIGIIPQYPVHSRYNIFARIAMPPVGIISVLTQLQKDHQVYVVDENNYGGPLESGMPDHSFLQGESPAELALFYGGMSNSIPRLFELAKQYKRFGAVTIAGGSHVDALPEEALRNGVDIVVHGEGEETMNEIMIAIAQGTPLRVIKGISILVDGNYLFTGKREATCRLDSFLDPDLTMVRYLKRRWSAIPINRGRGCDWNCEFCVVNKQYGAFKSKSVESAMRQIITYSDLGYRKFFITDDNFAQNRDEAIDLCRMVATYKENFRKKLRLIVQVRNEVAEDDELIKAMKDAGVTMLAIGYESPIDEDLQAMKKGVTAKKLILRSQKLSKHFYLHGMFIFGYPSERNTMSLSEREKRYSWFFRKARIDTIQVLNAVPLPGSELRERLKDDLLPVGWDKYDGQFLCYDSRRFGMDPYELQEIPRRLMKEWYLGNSFFSYVNYGNWMNWMYLATIGFPIQFSILYVKRFFQGLFSHKPLFFKHALTSTWRDICRKWRNLAIKTYAGHIVKRWMKEYRKSDYQKEISGIMS